MMMMIIIIIIIIIIITTKRAGLEISSASLIIHCSHTVPSEFIFSVNKTFNIIIVYMYI